MTITEFYIRFDQPVFYPGQMITGQVVVALDKPKEVRGVELKIKGRTKFRWTETENYSDTDEEGKSVTRSRTVTREGKESYLKNDQKLEGKKELTIGVHTYPFNVILPPSAPSTYTGKYGGIAYYGKAKVDIPFGTDKTVKNFFPVENWLDLNQYPQLKNPAKQEKSKTFCCFCCASGPLTLVAYVPRTGFAKTEAIPITVEIDNASNVKVESVKAALCRKVRWQAQGDSKDEKDKIKKIGFGDVPENSSKTWSENVALDCGPFPNIKNCNIITIDYKLEVEASPSGMHSDLEIDIPLTIGDIAYNDGESGVPPGPTPYPQSNPAPGGFMAPDAGMGYPSAAGMPNANVGFNPAAPAPYPAGGASPYPGGVNPSSYPSGPGANPQGPYPPAPGVYPQAPYPPAASGDGQGPYPPAQAPYAPPPAQYPAETQNGPAGYNPPAGSNSVVYPQAGGGQGFYDPNASSANNTSLFNASSVTMPASSFLGDQGGNTNASTPLLPSAPSAPPN